MFSSLTSIPGGFLPLPVISHPRFQHGSKTWVRLIFFPGQNLHPIPRCGDCTIAFRNCKSFLYKSNCRQTASFDTTRRQLTIRSNQINLCFSQSTAKQNAVYNRFQILLATGARKLGCTHGFCVGGQLFQSGFARAKASMPRMYAWNISSMV